MRRPAASAEAPALFRPACDRARRGALRKRAQFRSKWSPPPDEAGRGSHSHRQLSIVFPQPSDGFRPGFRGFDPSSCPDPFQHLCATGSPCQGGNFLPQHLGKGSTLTGGPFNQERVDLVRHIANLNHLAHEPRLACDSHAPGMNRRCRRFWPITVLDVRHLSGRTPGWCGNVPTGRRRCGRRLRPCAPGGPRRRRSGGCAGRRRA